MNWSSDSFPYGSSGCCLAHFLIPPISKMATFNDALLSPSLNNPNIPNIFELFALESMDHSLRQAVMYAIKVTEL